MLDKITNNDFGDSKAVHAPVDKDIKRMLMSSLGSYVESTNQSEVEISNRRSKRWLTCKDQVQSYLKPLPKMKWIFTRSIKEIVIFSLLLLSC